LNNHLEEEKLHFIKVNFKRRSRRRIMESIASRYSLSADLMSAQAGSPQHAGLRLRAKWII
jgi:hypothetical protein